MDSQIIGVLTGLICLMGLFYGVVPLLVLSAQKFQMPNLQPLDPNGLPPQMQQFFLGSLNGMLADGFTLIAYVAMPGMVTNVTPTFAYLVNYRTGDKAMVTCMFVNGPSGLQVKNPYVEYTARFADGRVVGTVNSKLVGATRQPPTKRVARFRKVTDPSELYRLHRFCVDRFSVDKNPVLPPQGEELTTFARSIVEDFDYQATCGLMRFQPRANHYSLTLYGAYYLTWAELFPMKQIRIAAADRDGDALLAEYRKAVAAGRA